MVQAWDGEKRIKNLEFSWWITLILKGHFHKSFELLIKIGLWLVVNSECCLSSTHEGVPAVLMSAVTGCKLAKLGWNNIETPEHFFPNFL